MNPNTSSIPEPLPSVLNDISTSSALFMPAHILTSAWPGDLRALVSPAQSQVCYEQMLRQAFSTSAPLTCQAKHSLLEWGLNCALEDMQQCPWPLPTRHQQHPLPSYENRTCLQMQPDVPCKAKSPRLRSTILRFALYQSDSPSFTPGQFQTLFKNVCVILSTFLYRDFWI